jgi:multifunctional methyltransferase subunit TRM112
VRPAEENLDFLRRFLPKLDWPALVDTARSLGDTALPDTMPEEWSDEQLKALHHVLLEVGVCRL